MVKKRNASRVVITLALVVFTAFLVLGFSISGVAYASNNDKVYLGGSPVGIIQDAEGAVITKITDVETSAGKVSPVGSAGGRVGDIIIKINGKDVKGADTIKSAVDNGGDTLILTLKRKDAVFELAVRAAFDIVVKEKKLGILMKDSIAGVGTLTFIRNDLTFGALGHRIYDNVASDKDIYGTGNLFQCNIVGYVKGVSGAAGELKGAFNRSDKPVGKIEKNNFSGVFGKYYNGSAIVGRELAVVGHKNEITPGAAKIYTTLSGKIPAYYDIEIVKTVVQNEAKEKSMVIRVTDPVLLSETGGIVQGMSGSPILQNSKIIGAVTHVFINDPTSGYGIYLDWMLQN